MNLDFSSFEEALGSLQRVLRRSETEPGDEDIRAACIQRFVEPSSGTFEGQSYAFDKTRKAIGENTDYTSNASTGQRGKDPTASVPFHVINMQ